MMTGKESIFKFAVMALCAAGIAWGAISWFINDKGTQELIQKEIWADLQGIEFEHRHDGATAPIIITGAVNSAKYDVLGVPSNDKTFPHAWIVLNAHREINKIYMVPNNSNIVLSCSYLGEIERQMKIDDVVKASLQDRCSK